uniref:Uncharacterized protein n=1 Tax=Candidatus Nitrotoga fabula TaxID=2182327 RepID=A0A2X0SD59_9PROT|nr:protein of unknown function [Candidatus Nitrotoga fabula]
MIHAQKGYSQSEGMAPTRNLEAVNRKRGRAVEGTGLENLRSGGTRAVKYNQNNVLVCSPWR